MATYIPVGQTKIESEPIKHAKSAMASRENFGET